VIPTIITQALSGSEIRVGSLAPTRDFSYVSDTVEGFLAAANEPSAIGKTINFGSGTEISIGDLANLIGRLMDKELTLMPEEQRVRPEASEVERLCADTRLAHQLLAWRSQVSLEEGLRQTIAWMGDNLGNFRVVEYAV
jgi:dTDP-glucose 4,6-dehydratase